MGDAVARLGAERLIAVLRVGRAELVEPAVAALAAGGIGSIELTFTIPAMAGALERTRSAYPDLLLGAGTIREPDQARAAAAAGADFLVTPHVEPRLLSSCLDTGLAAMPGVLTPSELAQALEAGAPLVKLFPAASVGTGHLKALLGPFPGVRIVPTGGIGRSDVRPWLEAGAFAVGVGGELASSELIEQSRFDELTAAAERFRTALP